jgi:hypothetical protein
VVDKILRQVPAVKKVIVRPHPDNRKPEVWLKLAASNPARVELSHPAYSLQFDLSRSSLVLGLFSGALATAAACGIPALFLWQPSWFYTPDLACFAPKLFVSPESVTERIETLLTHESEYMAARNDSLEAAKLYYHERKFCTFEPEFVGQLFSPIPPAGPAEVLAASQKGSDRKC